MKLVLNFILLVSVLMGSDSLAGAVDRRDQAPRGYTQNVTEEREQDYYEIYLIPPYRESTADYRGKVFNHQLTTEFRAKYVEKFGYIDANSLNYSANKFTQFDENRPVSGVETLNRDRRAYGEYMMRRLGEWHLDNFVKSEPSVRPLYEAKERLSNVQVEVGKQTKAKMSYSVSDNSAELVLENPYCDSKLRIEMDPKTFGPGPVLENRLYVGKSLSKKYYLNSYLADKDGIGSLELQKTITPTFGTAITISQPFRSEGLSVRETRVGAGLSHSF
jgi:hypothetical protein